MKNYAKSGVSLVIPVFNESEILSQQIKRVFAESKKHRIRLNECILVENGSLDNSWPLLLKLAKDYPTIKLIRLNQASYGQAVKAGILKASAPVIAVFNMDLLSFQFLKQALPLVRLTDIVVASKTLAASSDQRSLLRKLTTYFFNAFLRLVLNYPGTDTHGIKAFKNTQLLKRTLKNCRTKNELLDTELIVRMTRNKAILVELPIKVKELRPTRYKLSRRIRLTLADLLTALKSKYFSSTFAPKLKVADDFGISAHVNDAIIKAVQLKQVQIVSILSTHATKHEVEKLQPVLPSSRWSLHFNLVRGTPVSAPERIPSLVTSSGQFFPLWLFWLKLFFHRIQMEEVKTELTAQFRALSKMGVSPRCIDSEQHVHTFDPISSLVSQFATSNRLTIRSQTSTRHYLYHKPVRYAVLRVMQTLLTVRYRSANPLSPSYHAYISHPGSNYD